MRFQQQPQSLHQISLIVGDEDTGRRGGGKHDADAEANELPRAKLNVCNEMRSCLSCSGVPDRALAVRFRTGGVRLARQSDVRRALALAVVIAAGVALATFAARRSALAPPAIGSTRNDALARAKVLRPVPDIAKVAFAVNPANLSSFGSDDLVSCRYQPVEATGTTPKFDCALATGEVVKIKYGRNAELAAEAAATRLLDALGFGADRMYVVGRVRCYGCPPNPFRIQQAADLARGQKLLQKAVDYSKSTDFEWATVEREFEAPEITAGGSQGWAWWELDQIDPARGGASRAQVDAFRLMAVFLAHWDNKAENQRLVCLSGEPDGQRCREPFAMIQDTGATFGPAKVDLDGWQSAPIWSDERSCRLSMKALPHRGATFEDVSISEAGRRLLAERLTALRAPQILDLVLAARITTFDGSDAEPSEIDGWVQTFMTRIRQITEHPGCPR